MIRRPPRSPHFPYTTLFRSRRTPASWGRRPRTRFRSTRPVLRRFRKLDRPLLLAVIALAIYGLLTLYSAGRTDVATKIVATVWERQIAWLVLGIVGAVLVFRASPRLLEWAAPYIYGITVFVLLLTLVFGSGAGTAAGTRSWIT